MGAINEMLLKRTENQSTVSEDKKSPPPEQTAGETAKETSSTKSFSHFSIIPKTPQKVKGFRCNSVNTTYHTENLLKTLTPKLNKVGR